MVTETMRVTSKRRQGSSLGLVLHPAHRRQETGKEQEEKG
jgi:hypothetical protein